MTLEHTGGSFSSVIDPLFIYCVFSWQANQIVGPPDFYPGYGDTALGWDLSRENSGREWIELRFGASVCVSRHRSAPCTPPYLMHEEPRGARAHASGQEPRGTHTLGSVGGPRPSGKHQD